MQSSSMMLSESEISRLLASYGKDVRLIIRLFKDQFATTNPVHAWRSEQLNRVGFLDAEKTIEYVMHGAGCSVEFKDGKLVSFDWDTTGSYYFDPWKFKLYADSVGVNCDLLEEHYTRALAQSYFYRG